MLNACGVCELDIDQKKTGFTSFPCGHSYHSSCAHKFLSRHYSHCPKCNFGSVLPSDVQNTEKLKNPLDFGDDQRVSQFLDLRESLLEPEFTSVTPKRISKSIEESNKLEDKPASVISNFLDTSKITELLQGGGSSDKPVTSLKSQTTNPTALIAHRAPVELIVSKGITFKTLIRSGETPISLLKQGYNLHDFILLRGGWKDIINGNDGVDYRTFISYRDQLPIEYMVIYYGVNLPIFYNDLCYGQMKNLVETKLTVQEMKLLKGDLDSLLVLVKGFGGAAMTEFKHYQFNDWRSLGLSKETQSRCKITQEEARKMGFPERKTKQ